VEEFELSLVVAEHDPPGDTDRGTGLPRFGGALVARLVDVVPELAHALRLEATRALVVRGARAAAADASAVSDSRVLVVETRHGARP